MYPRLLGKIENHKSRYLYGDRGPLLRVTKSLVGCFSTIAAI